MSRLSDSMISENYESRERLMAWDVPAIAGDREAVKAVLQEYLVRLMFEHGKGWTKPYNELLWDAEQDATKEFNAAPINKRQDSLLGRVCTFGTCGEGHPFPLSCTCRCHRGAV